MFLQKAIPMQYLCESGNCLKLRKLLQCIQKSSQQTLLMTVEASAAFTLQRQQQRYCASAPSTFNSNNSTEDLTIKLLTPKHDWTRALSEAERLVGYPTSFLSLRWLLSDEIANVALHLRELVGSSHPLLKTAKHLLYNGKNTVQAWGLIVLLVSKAAGHAPSITDEERDKSAGVLHSQRALAEITEMIRMSHLVHNSMVNLHPTAAGKYATNYESMTFGNKIGLLTGDYLLGHSSAELATLRNQELVELISSAVRDFTEAEFIGERDEQNYPLPFKPAAHRRSANHNRSIDFDVHDASLPLDVSAAMGNPQLEWEVRNILNAGSLLGKACQAALKIAGQSEKLQREAYRFGKYLALTWQVCLDSEPFQTSTLPLDAEFSLVSAPVLFHLDEDPTLYAEIEKGSVSVHNVDYAKIHKAILADGRGLKRTHELKRKHAAAAMAELDKFEPTDARTALRNIILAMQEL